MTDTTFEMRIGTLSPELAAPAGDFSEILQPTSRRLGLEEAQDVASGVSAVPPSAQQVRSSKAVIQGTEGNDDLTGTSADDTFYGKGGHDNIVTNGGNDIAYGGDGRDSLVSNSVDPQEGVKFYGGNGHDILNGGSGADWLEGGTGDDWLWGKDGDDTILGGQGDDNIHGGDGKDTIDGGEGASDVLYYTFSTSGVTVDLQTGKGSGGEAEGDIFSNIEIVFGSTYDDVLRGDDKANTLYGGAGGNDWLEGRGGSDRYSVTGYTGGHVRIIEGATSGADQLTTYVDDPGKLVFTSSGNDVVITVEGDSSRSVTLVGQLRTAAGEGHGVESVVVSDYATSRTYSRDEIMAIVLAGDNTLTGDSAANTILGLAGNDVIKGMDGDDTLRGGDGNDWLGGGAGNDALMGEQGNDVLYGGEGNDELWGGTEDDELWGEAGSDKLMGDDGNDTLRGGSGADE
ncbi:calcium-binding protein, partial [Aestuariivirga sp.]|uniref:calcium-binding protein n=1 Tax=Aestuariivirga sp. TaxID=2650926 RepID=UPI00391B0898